MAGGGSDTDRTTRFGLSTASADSGITAITPAARLKATLTIRDPSEVTSASSLVSRSVRASWPVIAERLAGLAHRASYAGRMAAPVCRKRHANDELSGRRERPR